MFIVLSLPICLLLSVPFQVKATAAGAGRTKLDAVGMIQAFKVGIASGTRYTFADGLALENSFRIRP